MWTPTTRQQHSRPVTRYQTDLTDAEWRVIAPHLPKPRATGRPRAWPMREIVNGIFYVMRAGCPWRLLPKDLPPWGTIYRWFATWRDDGRFERINHALVMADRERVGRDASPSAAIIDCRSAKTTEAGGPRGYDAGKKINGRKRHALVDTDGRGLVLDRPNSSVAPNSVKRARSFLPRARGWAARCLLDLLGPPGRCSGNTLFSELLLGRFWFGATMELGRLGRPMMMMTSASPGRCGGDGGAGAGAGRAQRGTGSSTTVGKFRSTEGRALGFARAGRGTERSAESVLR
jgi:transposase